MWIDTLAHSFDPRIVARGNGYARQARVRTVHTNPDGLAAIVQGTHTYIVRVQVERTARAVRLKASCNCPYADPCKHLWAALAHAGDRLDADWGQAPDLPVRVRRVQPQELSKRVAASRAEAPGNPTPAEDSAAASPRRGSKPAWMRELARLADREPARQSFGAMDLRRADLGPIAGRLWYLVHGSSATLEYGFALQIYVEDSRPSAGRGSRAMPGHAGQLLRALELRRGDAARLQDEVDRSIVSMLLGPVQPFESADLPSWKLGVHGRGDHRWHLDPTTSGALLDAIARSGRLCTMAQQGDMVTPLEWQPDREWQLELRVGSAAEHRLQAVLACGDECRPLDAQAAVSLGADGSGFVLWPGVLARAKGHPGLLRWCQNSLGEDGVRIRPSDVKDLVMGLSAAGFPIAVQFPPAWKVREESAASPRGRVTLTARRSPYKILAPYNHLWGMLEWNYDGEVLDADVAGEVACVRHDQGGTVIIRRDPGLEARLCHRLGELGCVARDGERMRTLPVRQLDTLVHALMKEGWDVRGERGAYRRAGAVTVRARGKMDWFELSGTVEYAEGEATVAEVLDALAAGRRYVLLSDGTEGLLPTEWLERHGPALGLGQRCGDGVRFHASQVSVLDALLEQLPDARADAAVARARKRLRSFDGIAAREEPSTFKGTLRPYQREGLGWLAFLHEFGFGGCLADDMGLGKTVQLIAHMLDVRRRGDPAWLVVAPKSVCANWVSEAGKFAPQLRVVSHTGQSRSRAVGGFGKCDLVVTTYSTMRLDIERLSKERFGCVVLDEAQAIKNSTSQVSKAARLLVAGRRMALTGTPVENRMEDLWSIFDFLNPGMLGELSRFRALIAEAGNQPEAESTVDGESARLLRRALRPFMLRRAKAAVARDLPPRVEQVVLCDLEGPQKALYASLRAHYQSRLLGEVRARGMNQSRMHVLEALLRLRQVACHARLVQPDAREPASAKCAALMDMLEELRDEGHRSLVFSQFTTLLDLVEGELNKRGIAHERLDGKVSARDRARAVERFQGEDGAGVFLVSLKAGGTGLNLTAAEYVFLLDPWWNPAVEAQAIDRAHRLGQDRTVLAYRMIARGTVEERILQLQERKRGLASSIVGEQDGPLSAMSVEDLEWILA